MIGKYPAKLDEKSRLFVPSKLRAELGVFWKYWAPNLSSS